MFFCIERESIIVIYFDFFNNFIDLVLSVNNKKSIFMRIKRCAIFHTSRVMKEMICKDYSRFIFYGSLIKLYSPQMVYNKFDAVAQPTNVDWYS